MSDINRVTGYFQNHRQQYRRDLETLVAIPGVSFPGFDRGELVRSADAVVQLLTQRGFRNIEKLSVPGAPDAVYADVIRDVSLPTLLLYAHYDVQPVGDPDVWNTEPFKATEKEGRLYGRGTADDKAGILVHVASVDAWLKSGGALPVNVKIFIEGEEEVGSPHLGVFAEKYREKLKADVLVLTDTSNFAEGVPSITTKLRGLVVVDVELRALKGAIHSGMWGGPIPDPVLGLCRLLGKLVDEQGRIQIPGFYDDVRPLEKTELEALKNLPGDEQEFREQAGILEGVHLLGSAGKKTLRDLYERIWHQPSLILNAIQASSRKDARNILCESAWARVGIRIVPDMDPVKVRNSLVRFLEEHRPWGLRLEVTTHTASAAWRTEPSHPVFAVAQKAMARAYGRDPLLIGCGGSIPFVKILGETFEGVPAILVGIEDPFTNAHGPNESLSLSDFEKAVCASICFYEELARLGFSESVGTSVPART